MNRQLAETAIPTAQHVRIGIDVQPDLVGRQPPALVVRAIVVRHVVVRVGTDVARIVPRQDGSPHTGRHVPVVQVVPNHLGCFFTL